MGWTHDHRDVSRSTREKNRETSVRKRGAGPRAVSHSPRTAHDARMGIPRILRRRARWVGARLRHPRG
ncbi:hypothetical protein [Streptomyces tardus]|uniref:hypothetical protein n=1 Tax=Streptomyces tardus TaxID=2780544 RepID=UPI001F44942F